jgi:hypothetical protein
MTVPLTLLGLLERWLADPAPPEPDLNGELIADHALYRLEADLLWIDHTAARLDLLARAVQR